VVAGGVADRDRLDRGLQQFEEPLVHLALDQDPGPGAAVLPGVVERGNRGGGRGPFQVGIGEHDVGALPAEFHRDPLHLPGTAGHDLPPHLPRATPVKPILRTSAWSISRWPPTEPLPGSTWNTPSGRPASSASSPILIAVSGVRSAGLAITGLPAASAGATPQPRIGIGKFHGTMTPTTPIGSWQATSRRPGTGICLPHSRSGAAA